MSTIKDVAERAGVARSTVSHALNGNYPVSDETRKRVLAAASQLDYHPDAIASSLRSRRTRITGLAIPLDVPDRSLSHSSFSQFIECIADELSRHDYRLLCLISRSPQAPELVRLAREGHVDGMLLLQMRVDDPRVDALRATGLPFVAMGKPVRTRDCIWVEHDLRGGAGIAVEHLLRGGHRRIAFLGDNPVFGYQYNALAGFRQAHRTFKLPWQRELVLHCEGVQEVGTALRPFADRKDGPTALITTTDIEAVAALHALVGMGLRVPDDVAIVTLGDSVFTQLVQPPITAVYYSVEEFCRLAVQMLLAMMSGQHPAQRHQILPMTLIPRGSTTSSR